MGTRRFRNTNHQAIAGFLLPFLAAGVASAFVLYERGGLQPRLFQFLFFAVIPGILVAGLVLSLRSIPRIQDQGDKDYAFAGLVLNIFFSVIYILSVLYCLIILPE